MSAAWQRTPIRIPVREWGAESVRIVNWLVEQGEAVMAGDVLVEVGVPGILGDVRATVDGRVAEICRVENEWVTTETTLGWLETAAEMSHNPPDAG